MTSPKLEKIKSAEFRALVEEQSPRRVDVLVELRPPKFAMTIVKSAERKSKVRSVKALSPKEDEERLRRVRDWLVKHLELKPQLLRSANAFVVHANGAELKEIARSDDVAAIWPNRRLLAPLSRRKRTKSDGLSF